MVKQQKTLLSFFQPGATTKLKPKSKFNLHTTRVTKAEEGFQQGHLIHFDTESGYRVKFHNVQEEKEWWSEAQVKQGIELHQAVARGVQVAKFFGDDTDEHVLYKGTVISATHDAGWLYKIQYEDDDREDLDPQELQEAQDLYMKTQKKKRKASPKPIELSKKTRPNVTLKAGAIQNAATPPTASDESSDGCFDDRIDEEAVVPRTKTKRTESSSTANSRRRKAVQYLEVENTDDEEDVPFKKQKRKGSKLTKKRTARLEDDSDFDEGDADSDEESLDADMDDAVSSEDEEPVPKKKKAPTKRTVPSIIGTKKSLKSISSQQVQDEFQKKLQKDLKSERPKNNPQKLPDKPYVDPVGVDPTNGIVEGIVGAQVRKVGELLLKAIQHSSSDNKALAFPIKLQTACSGTDAPSIALGLIQESLNQLGTRNHGFTYSHVMSCEIESFKQAYIGRNFPGVPLFPDITKLTASELVLDVYGQEQTIPDGNLFVAGTSCKDFSMLKTRDRLDIEDKGTSGETFLAAVEFLEQKQPPVAIFENVDGAPWEKMQEYIRGRLNLAHRNDTKAIKDSKGKADADNLLLFSVNEHGAYVAEQIPRQVGIRAGAIVQGFVASGCSADDVTAMKAPEEWRGKRKTVSLKEMAKKHGIDLDADTLVLEKKARYCTHLCKVDTKKYGLPQTRNRKYLFIWRSEDPDDDLGDYFQEILNHLETPLFHSMDAFLLPETHDRIRCFREALRSGPGLLVHRERAKELDFWNFEEARIKDVTCHLAFRMANGIDERARYLTGWDVRGKKLLAPTLWPELFDCWNHRRLDMIDCFNAAAGK